MDWQALIRDLGFPVAVAAFVLLRIDRKLGSVIAHLNVMSQALGQALGVKIVKPLNGDTHKREI